MGADQEKRFDRDPDYWWLRLRYAQRDGDSQVVLEARKRLHELGFHIGIDSGSAPSAGGVNR